MLIDKSFQKCLKNLYLLNLTGKTLGLTLNFKNLVQHFGVHTFKISSRSHVVEAIIGVSNKSSKAMEFLHLAKEVQQPRKLSKRGATVSLRPCVTCSCIASLTPPRGPQTPFWGWSGRGGQGMIYLPGHRGVAHSCRISVFCLRGALHPAPLRRPKDGVALAR